MIKAVFFDLYQTLVGYDPPREEWESQALDSLGIKAPAKAFAKAFIIADEYFYTENAKKPMSKRSPEDVKAVYARHQAIVLKEGGIEPNPDIIRAMLVRFRDAKLKQVLFDDVIATLSELKRRNRIIGVVSNVDKDIKPLMDELGVSPFLTTVVTSQETGFTKPHPEIFLEAIRRVDLPPEQIIFVGDQYQIDVVGSSAVGMKAVLLDRGGFSEVPADCPRVRTLYQLTNMIDG
ncbi:putative hydrolase of the HAD superfamily [Dehalogenimonas formicexedens]|uniref:Putative hydrolase of the HAD superfamily n=1 Tax=Dehalogenimonas formicexedens TaxID=1839801 RepID=A0A1P8F6C3_9CHLR|nr:HAD family hydrolase [Dehalogenimonas formicexedens]APV44037.1 putative hydrolase of the HAD superfamily [Dehalogenimonas formicexedens]